MLCAVRDVYTAVAGLGIALAGVFVPVLFPTVSHFVAESLFWAGILLAVAGFAGLVVDLVRRRSTAALTRPTPASNPIVATAQVHLVRYQKGEGRLMDGLVVANASDTTAFDVSMPNFSFGRFTVSVGDASPATIPRLSKEDGEHILGAIWTSDSPGSSTHGIYDQLLQWEKAHGKEREGLPVRCVVKWREGYSHWFEMGYLIQRDVFTVVSITPDPDYLVPRLVS